MTKAKPIPSKLGIFDGAEVIGASVKITNAGDGLSTAMGIEPIEYHIGDTVCVVLQCEVTRITYERVKDTDRLMRVHTFRAGIATVVDDTLVADVLADQKKKNLEAVGVVELDFPDDEPND